MLASVSAKRSAPAGKAPLTDKQREYQMIVADLGEGKSTLRRRRYQKDGERPKIPAGFMIRPESKEWIEENLPRSVSFSAFVDEAVAERIDKIKRVRVK